MSGNPIITAKANRFREFLTETFRKRFGALRSDLGHKEIIESAVEEYKAKLRTDMATRTRKRRRHRRTIDLFNSDDEGGAEGYRPTDRPDIRLSA